MRRSTAFLIALTLMVAGLAPAHAADAPAVARAKEMLRRAQDQLRQAQSDNAELQHAKTAAEQKLQDAQKMIEAAKSGSQAAERGARAKLQAAKGIQDDLGQKLTAKDARIAALDQKQSDMAKQIAARDEEIAQARKALAQSTAATASCEDKNAKLYTYGQEMVERYRTKGVWSALSQKDPVLGLKEVDIENVVQEYQLKLAGERVYRTAP